MKPVFTAHVEKGKLIWDAQEQVIGHLRGLECKNVAVTISRRHKNRSIPQNSWYWGCVVALISEYTGFTPEETHDALKSKFLSIPGGKLTKIKSTTGLSTVEFSRYCEEIQRWAAEKLEVYIPDPEGVDV